MLFAALGYSAALVFEWLRLTRRVRSRLHWEAFISALAGFILHSIFLYQHHIVASQPLGGVAMLLHASAWGLVLIYIVWMYRQPNIPFGIVVLPLAILLLIIGHLLASTFETTGLSLRSLAKMLHLISAAGFMIAILVYMICRCLYFIEVRLLRKRRSLASPHKLPSLEWSATISHIALVSAACCLCLCASGGLAYIYL